MGRGDLTVFLKKSVGNGRVYLSFVQGYRHNGKVKQKTVEKLGYLDDLQKIYPDPIEHFTQVARQRSAQAGLPAGARYGFKSAAGPERSANRPWTDHLRRGGVCAVHITGNPHVLSHFG